MSVTVSLVVCTIGRKEPLVRLLKSLRDQNFTDFEVLIVDQNPAGFLDDVLGEHRILTIRHLRSPKGLSRSRNVGLDAADGEIVGFPDDDCWYHPRVLARTVSFFDASPDIAVLTGRTLDAAGNESVSRYLRESGPVTRDNAFIAGVAATMFARRRAAFDVGGFDESLGVGCPTPFQSGEETDFVLRCLAAGHQVYFDRNHTLHHDQVAVPVERARAYALGFGRVARMHDLGTGFIAARTCRTALGACWRVARGDLDGARQRVAWLGGSIAGYRAPLDAGRTGTPAGRVAP